MSDSINKEVAEKGQFHARNKHSGRYDMMALIALVPELKPMVTTNKFNVESINFADPQAVKLLNYAILKKDYGISWWDIPEGYLCPPIPGRADYIHHVADMMGSDNRGVCPQGPSVKVLDVGIGSNAIYPIIGKSEYGWSFVGCDVDKIALENAQKIVDQNPDLAGSLSLRLQTNAFNILNGVITPDDEFDLVVCNPPFHSNSEEAQAGTHRKWKNLGKAPAQRDVKNFGGQSGELFFPGGEQAFISKMIDESAGFAKNCCWFTTLVSKADNMHLLHRVLKKSGAKAVRTLPMSQGQKSSRVLAWTFLDEEGLKIWRERKFWSS